jgi:hypothetical protein
MGKTHRCPAMTTRLCIVAGRGLSYRVPLERAGGYKQQPRCRSPRSTTWPPVRDSGSLHLPRRGGRPRPSRRRRGLDPDSSSRGESERGCGRASFRELCWARCVGVPETHPPWRDARTELCHCISVLSVAWGLPGFLGGLVIGLNRSSVETVGVRRTPPAVGSASHAAHRAPI